LSLTFRYLTCLLDKGHIKFPGGLYLFITECYCY